MKITLLDDEPLALSYLEHQLNKIENLEIIAKFTNPHDFETFILNENVDIAFMDIHLPEINGIELADKILQTKPQINIVFITAFDDYALEAFELNALDYIMKPVQMKRLLKTINRIKDRLEIPPIASAPKILRLNLFKHFSMESEERQLTPRWRTTKAQELFLYLLHNRGLLVQKHLVIDMLWPDFEINKATSQLYTTIYHIRKTLEPYSQYFQIKNMTSGYILHTQNVELDIEKWEKKLQSLPPLTEETIEFYEKVVRMYAGDYLQDFEFFWAESERYRLKTLWLNKALQIAKWYTVKGQENKAIETYLQITKRHPQAEEAHFSLMKLYAKLNYPPAVDQQYSILNNALLEELDITPSPYISEWYAIWKNKNKE
ncbi:two-component SAPR family response regulator [Pullulanibacillus pueri]|uniref:DNA-binding response regulator n=1 Tax=Pullulanibacillus pueri TaxID=1437324 RepID=A0A8J3ENW1_9BACL|nr:response regulator [Pullulanibacillus pueri]MBM7683925.1 two-component SAPR family response regulator [Pullulanibacillus pueri]GGH87924.1 DNA-binding response regulator [Pullulanibacillus pueri]